MIGFYHGSSLPVTANLKSGIYFIVNSGKGKLYKVLADATDPVLVAETTDASLIADVAKAKEDIQKNATSVANALTAITKITDLHGETLKNITDEASAIRTLAQGAKDQAATNKTDIATANGKITANTNAISAMKEGATIVTFKGIEDALAGKQAAGDYATKTEAQGYANAAAKAVDDKLGFTAGTGADDPKTLKAYVDKKTADMATSSTITDIQGRLSKIEGDYLTSAEETELNNAIKLKADKTALEGEVTRAKGEEARIEGLVTAEASRADKEEKRIVGLVESEASRAAGAEEALDERLEKVEAFFEGAAEDGEGLQNALDTLVEIQTYVDTHGEAAAKMVEDIQDNAKAIEAIEKDYLKATDKTELSNAINGVTGRVTTSEGKIGALEAKFNGSGNGTVAKMIADAVAVETGARETGVNEAKAAAKAADDKAVQAQKEVDNLETVVAGKAAQSALETLQGRVKTVEDDLNTASTGLKAKMTTAECEIDALQAALNTASTGIKARLTAVETKAANNATAIGTNTTSIEALMEALSWQQV